MENLSETTDKQCTIPSTTQRSTKYFTLHSVKQNQRSQIFRNTFLHQIKDEPLFRSFTKDNSQHKQKSKIQKDFEIYTTLKNLRNLDTILYQKSGQKNQEKNETISKFTLFRKKTQLKKMKQAEFEQEKQYENKKTELLAENNQQLRKDLVTLDSLSKNAFFKFKTQINLYNRFYSNFISEEVPLDKLHEPIRKTDLNISPRQVTLFKDGDILSPSQIIVQVKQKLSEVERKKYSYKNQLRNNYSEDNLFFDKTQKTQSVRIENTKDYFSQTNEKLSQIKQKFNQISPSELEKEFIRAVKQGDQQFVDYCLKMQPQLVDSKDILNQSALHWAAKRNNQKMLSFLIEKGAKLGTKDLLERTPKVLASQFQNHYIARLIGCLEDGKAPPNKNLRQK